VLQIRITLKFKRKKDMKYLNDQWKRKGMSALVDVFYIRSNILELTER